PPWSGKPPAAALAVPMTRKTSRPATKPSCTRTAQLLRSTAAPPTRAACDDAAASGPITRATRQAGAERFLACRAQQDCRPARPVASLGAGGATLGDPYPPHKQAWQRVPGCGKDVTDAMAVYTEIGDDELRAFTGLYEIGEVLSCKGIAEGVENSNFLLTTERANFILTLYEKRVAPADLPSFIALMDHLADHGVACPT